MTKRVATTATNTRGEKVTVYGQLSEDGTEFTLWVANGAVYGWFPVSTLPGGTLTGKHLHDYLAAKAA